MSKESWCQNKWVKRMLMLNESGCQKKVNDNIKCVKRTMMSNESSCRKKADV